MQPNSTNHPQKARQRAWEDRASIDMRVGGRTNQLLIQLSSRRDTQRTNKLLKIDGAIFIIIEHVEDVVCKAGGIAEGEELFVYLLEFGFVEGAGGAVF